MDDSRDRLISLCLKGLKARCQALPVQKGRLKQELLEIDNQAEHDYFLDLYDRKAKFQSNENNLLVPFLLGLTDEFDPSGDPHFVQGEFPDIDVDYLPLVQEYLRNDWCPRTFGRDKVVNIGNYGTFGIKSALLDMARVHGADHQEIQAITKNLQDKDEEGRPLTWDKALEATPELAAYCEKNPEIADAASRLIDRNRGRGKHAGGTVVSSIKIDDLVPIMIDTDGNPVSGWTEGLNEQDLQPVGLIKFDVLAVKDLLRIAHCCNLVRQRHPEVRGISAREGGSDWSDTAYLNDPKALEIANRAETRGIFQFDGEGMRKLIKAGGVDRFEDLVAYSSLFRPGPLGMKMHERYVERKRGREEWEGDIPECMRDVLFKTYGILVYQEQVMKILNVVGDIPLIHCEKIRKAISKKKTAEFMKYKQIFLESGSKKTGWPIDSDDEKNMNRLFDLLASFSAYGFNRSHAVAYTFTSSRLLYLKAHYPLEFFCSTLMLEGDEDKVKMYKREAERSGIKVNRCDIDRSGVEYQIVGDEIYVGFSNIKGVGREVAEKIAAGRPYAGFPDFLSRFGTDKRVVEPLVNLGVFNDAPPNLLMEFYEDYKKWTKGNNDKGKRNIKRRDELLESMASMARKSASGVVTHDFVMALYETGDPDPLDRVLSDGFTQVDFMGVVKKYARSVLNFEHKSDIAKRNSISFENWASEGRYPADKWPSQFELERKYYGFSWEHPIQKSPDYIGGHSFNAFKEDETIVAAGVEVLVVKKPLEKVSKNKNRYYNVIVEDEDWNTEMVTFWADDFDRFKEELEFWDEASSMGSFLRMRVTRPGPGFKSYTFQSPSKRDRHRLVPSDKKNDPRLQVMRPPK